MGLSFLLACVLPRRTLACAYWCCPSVLVLAGIELIFFLASGIALCFAFRVTINVDTILMF